MVQPPRPDSSSPRPQECSADLELVAAVSGGSLAAWHDLVNRYAGLIYGVIRRQLFNEDEDDIRGVYVDVLEALYRGGLSTYAGRSTLATWLIVFSRNRARDLLRKRYGRERFPRWYEQLDELQQELVRLYFVEKLPLEVILHQLDWGGHETSADAVVGALLELKDRIPDRYLRRLGPGAVSHEDLEAHSPALLRYLQDLKNRVDEMGATPEMRLIQQDDRARIEKLRRALAELPPRDREVLKLKYEGGWTARRIAGRLGLDSPRQVYSLVGRSLARLKKALGDEADVP